MTTEPTNTAELVARLDEACRGEAHGVTIVPTADLHALRAALLASERRMREEHASKIKWHDIAMKAGVVVCRDGSLLYPAEDARVAEAALSVVEKERDHHKANHASIVKRYRKRAVMISDLRAALSVALAEKERMREALERLGSMKAFVVSRTVKSGQDDELIARVNYARVTLNPEEAPAHD
jgi:hypothetical protein